MVPYLCNTAQLYAAPIEAVIMQESLKKTVAVKQNLIKANAAWKTKAEERRRLRAAKDQVPPEKSSGFPQES